jgi:hypothetical protein
VAERDKTIEKSVTKTYIDVVIEEDTNWMFTGVYGEPSWNQKLVTWDALHNLHGQMQKLWLALGDINEILFNYEKEGGRPRAQQAMQAFHDTLKDCDLEDM